MSNGEEGQAQEPLWGERDLLLGVAEVLHTLMAYMVVMKQVPPEKMKALVEIAANRIEKEGGPKSALAIRHTFKGALNGEWAGARDLADPEKSAGSA